MEWGKNMRIGSSVRHSRRLRYQITHRQVHPAVYLIVCDLQAQGRLEILPSTVLLQKEYPEEALYVAGMAGYRREALEIVASLVEDTYRETNAFDTFRYLTGREIPTC